MKKKTHCNKYKISSMDTNDARAVDYWRVFKEYIETNTLRSVLESFNQTALRSVINGLKGKREFLDRCLNRHDVIYE